MSGSFRTQIGRQKGILKQRMDEVEVSLKSNPQGLAADVLQTKSQKRSCISSEKKEGFLAVMDKGYDSLDLINSKLKEFGLKTGVRVTGGAESPATVPSSFDGNLRKYREFWGTFKLLHDDPTVATVGKLIELKKHLKGSARRLLEGMPITDPSYD
ncbi:hypothetical protein L596_030829 [Steinernema carpocapsae]|uniref:Uncharacterized protein n=1 Tax=Steinernema carpocapsae TaxID=34508 RepID=A0A4U5LN72_STECR|nr:hypothetical protein L596_030829 [Steinernema carpocapsae]